MAQSAASKRTVKRQTTGMSHASQWWDSEAQLTLKQACFAEQVYFTQSLEHYACNIGTNIQEMAGASIQLWLSKNIWICMPAPLPPVLSAL